MLICNKQVWFVRHGEAEHNISDDFDCPDPALTETGKQQAHKVSRDTESGLRYALYNKDKHNRPQLIITSPLRRTIQTTIAAFGDLRPSIPIICHPDIQETHAGERPCDTGTPTTGLIEEFGGGLIDFSSLQENWWDLDGIEDGTEWALSKRFDRFTSWLSKRPEDRIIIVAHKGVFKRMHRRVFKNCEVRKYILDGTTWVDLNHPLSLEATVSIFFLLLTTVVISLVMLVRSVSDSNLE
jgi:broad specificity phosphatase PhoE